MKRHWNAQELRERWSLSVEERSLLAQKPVGLCRATGMLPTSKPVPSRLPRGPAGV
jgi:hypothetical protein